MGKMSGKSNPRPLWIREGGGNDPDPGFGVLLFLINPKCPWLRSRQQGGTERRRKHKS